MFLDATDSIDVLDPNVSGSGWRTKGIRLHVEASDDSPGHVTPFTARIDLMLLKAATPRALISDIAVKCVDEEAPRGTAAPSAESTYFLPPSSDAATFDSARMYCQNNSGHLAAIHNEQQFRETLHLCGQRMATVDDPDGPRGCWIGLTRPPPPPEHGTPRAQNWKWMDQTLDHPEGTPYEHRQSQWLSPFPPQWGDCVVVQQRPFAPDHDHHHFGWNDMECADVDPGFMPLCQWNATDKHSKPTQLDTEWLNAKAPTLPLPTPHTVKHTVTAHTETGTDTDTDTKSARSLTGGILLPTRPTCTEAKCTPWHVGSDPDHNCMAGTPTQGCFCEDGYGAELTGRWHYDPINSITYHEYTCCSDGGTYDGTCGDYVPPHGFCRGPDKLTRSEAHTFCDDLGLTLATIRDNTDFETTSDLCPTTDQCWIGLEYCSGSGSYTWDSGSSKDYGFGFANGQPTGGNHPWYYGNPGEPNSGYDCNCVALKNWPYNQ